MAQSTAQDELLPIVIEAPADRKTRDKWLDRLWQAIEDDGIDYLCPVVSRWGELCGAREVASHWADRFLGLLCHGLVRSATRELCLRNQRLPPQPASGWRYKELLEVLALQRFPLWHDRKFGVQALLAESRTDEALVYAKASRGLNQPETAIDVACEKILLAWMSI